MTRLSSNLYKQRYTVPVQNQTRVINSNEAVAARLEELRQASLKAEGGFVEGLIAEKVEVELPPPEPEISLEEIQAEADAMIQEAKAEAERLVEEARQQAGTVTEEAKTEGRRQGYEAGREKADQELEKQKLLLEDRRRELEAEYQRLRDSLEPQVLDVVCGVFEKVFHIQFDQYKEILLHLVKQAILKIESTREFQIRVGEKNYPYMEEHRAEILGQVGQNIRLEIEADASLDDTQCVIETDSGFFDCSIQVQFENVIKAIRSLVV